jgi:hypothetical protein
MLCGNGINLYFCSVKSQVRYIAAATSSVFCAICLILVYSRKECGSSNAHRVFALENLTAPIAAFLLSNLKCQVL